MVLCCNVGGWNAGWRLGGAAGGWSTGGGKSKILRQGPPRSHLAGTPCGGGRRRCGWGGAPCEMVAEEDSPCGPVASVVLVEGDPKPFASSLVHLLLVEDSEDYAAGGGGFAVGEIAVGVVWWNLCWVWWNLWRNLVESVVGEVESLVESVVGVVESMVESVVGVLESVVGC